MFRKNLHNLNFWCKQHFITLITDYKIQTLIVDLAVPIDICLSDHLVYLLVGQLFPQVRHDVTQFCGTDIAVSILNINKVDCYPIQKFGEQNYPGRNKVRSSFITLSKTLKASLISSSLSVSFIFLAIMVRNSGKSIVPLPWG